MNRQVFLIINKKIYEVSRFVSSHPGEGIKNVYLEEFNRKEVSSLFEKHHATDEAFDMLKLADKGGNDKIQYVCPNYFKRKIPKYFHMIGTSDDGLKELQKWSQSYPKKSFFIFPNSDKNSLNLYVKDNLGMSSQHKLEYEDTYFEDDPEEFERKWFVSLYGYDYENKTEVITCRLEANTVEEFVEKHFEKQGYTPIIKLKLN